MAVPSGSLFQVDLFATRDNARLPDFVSPFPDPMALGVDAFSLHWGDWDSIYLFPPVKALHRVVPLLTHFQGHGVLVAPLYSPSGWFPALLRRSPDPIPLPSSLRLSQPSPEGIVFHEDPSVFMLHAWRLKLALLASGWTEESVTMLLRAHKFSTSRQYQAIWSKFLMYLSMRRLSAVDVSVGVVCGFLCYHAVALGRAYRTLSGYRSALRHPLLFALDLEVNCEASDLCLRGIFNYVPPDKAKSVPGLRGPWVCYFLQYWSPLLSLLSLCPFFASLRRPSAFSSLPRGGG